METAQNEIRVTSKGQIKKYLGYALRVLTKTELKDLRIRATGNAIVKALILIEIVKRRVGDLHQINEITSTEIIDELEPQVEGLEKIEQKRRVTCLDCHLSKDPLDTQHVGYQPPQPKDKDSEVPFSGEGQRRFEGRRNDNKPERGGARPQQRRRYNDGQDEPKEGGAGNRYQGAPRNDRGGDRGGYRGGNRGGYRGGDRGDGQRPRRYNSEEGRPGPGPGGPPAGRYNDRGGRGGYDRMAPPRNGGGEGGYPRKPFRPQE